MTRRPYRKLGATRKFEGAGAKCPLKTAAFRILRTDENRTRRPHGRDTMSGHRTVYAEHKAVVAKNLEIVSGPVARHQSLIVQHRFALIGHHGKMASKTIGRPRGVACIASHAAIGVRELR